MADLDRPHSFDGVALSPLAVAASRFWGARQLAVLALPIGMRAESVEAIEALRELAECGPVAIRARSAAAVAPFVEALSDLVKDNPQ